MSDVILSKNVVAAGGSYEDRQAYISKTREAFLKRWSSARVFTLSEHISDSDRYLKSVKNEFPIKPFDKSKTALSSDQLNDSYLEWVPAAKVVLVVIPEAQKLFKNNPAYFYQVMGDYMAMQQRLKNQGTIRFVATLSDAPTIDVEKIPVLIGGDWRPSDKDLAVVQLPS